jgi:hypothetical protein
MPDDVLGEQLGQGLHIAAGRGRPPQAAARRAGLEFVEKLLTAMIWVVPSVAGLTRRLTGLVP